MNTGRQINTNYLSVEITVSTMSRTGMKIRLLVGYNDQLTTALYSQLRSQLTHVIEGGQHVTRPASERVVVTEDVVASVVAAGAFQTGRAVVANLSDDGILHIEVDMRPDSAQPADDADTPDARG